MALEVTYCESCGAIYGPVVADDCTTWCIPCWNSLLADDGKAELTEEEINEMQMEFLNDVLRDAVVQMSELGMDDADILDAMKQALEEAFEEDE
jgi:hypothetical protein